MESTALGALILPACLGCLVGMAGGLVVRAAIVGLDALVTRRPVRDRPAAHGVPGTRRVR